MIKHRLVVTEDSLKRTVVESINLLQKVRFFEKKYEHDKKPETEILLKKWRGHADMWLASLTTEPDPDFIQAEK